MSFRDRQGGIYGDARLLDINFYRMCDCGKCIERKMREFFKKELEKLKWNNLSKEERI